MNTWTILPLSDIAKPVIRPVHVETGRTYRTIGVKWWGEGAYERQTIDGAETAASVLSLVKDGDLIINKIWVRHGSTAIATQAVDGCAASNEFPTFELDSARILPRWMHWITKSTWFWNKCDALSKGTSGKNRIKPEKFLTITIPVPAITEQQRLLDRIDTIAANINDAGRLIGESNEELANLCRSILHDTSHGDPVPTPMSELVTLRQPDVTVSTDQTYHFAGVYCFGGGVFVGQKKSGLEFAYPRLTQLRTGNFVYPKLMAWEGALAVVPPECNGLVVSTEFPVFEINEEKVFPEVLDVYFRSPAIWPALSGSSTGTNVRRRRLNPADFLSYRMPLPNRQVQETLRQANRRVHQIREQHETSTKELTAMLPAILDRAFRGEL